MYLKKDFLYKIVITILLLFLLFIIGFNLLNVGKEGFTPLKSSVDTTTTTTKKIAFCFLIYDSINHEELWKKFFDSGDANRYNIYIHYKENLPLKYFEENKLDYCIPTVWGDKSLVKASNLLFKKAYDDPQNYKFVLLSNSCIPLKSFDYIYEFLTRDNMGYVNSSTCSDYYKQFDMYKNNPALFAKSSQWVILNREMVEKTALDKDDYIDKNFNYMHAVDEIYYYTMIKHLEMENQLVITDNASSGATTFIYWYGMDYPYSKDKTSGANPYSYDSISSEEMKYLLAQPCLFGRKFNKNCSVDNINLDEYIGDTFI